MKLTYFLICVLLCLKVAACSERSRLSLVTFIMQTGQPPSTGLACQASMRVVVEEANRREDILPQYFLDMEVKDEQKFSYGAAEAFIDFIDNTSSNAVAPVTVGPSTNCQFPSPIIRQFKMTEFSHGCGGAVLVNNRNLYSNLYRVGMPADSLSIGILKFVKEIGHWNQLGIAASAATANEYLMAKNLQEQAVKNGLKVVKFNADVDFSREFALDFKQSDARVIAVISTQGPMCAKFLCQAYKVGIRAPNYVFVLPYICYFVPQLTPLQVSECTMEIVNEQTKAIFWIGLTKLFGGTYFGTSSFGYNVAEFERRLNYSLGNKSQLVPDYLSRLMCHDSMMAAVITLNNSDHLLRSKYNLTLGDFHQGVVSNDVIIQHVVNETAASFDFLGLRSGRLYMSPRLEIDNENQSISQIFGGEMRYLYDVYLKAELGNRSVYDLSLYGFNPMGKAPIWLTKSGHPPKDLSAIIHLQNVIPHSAAISLNVMAAATLSVQVVMLIVGLVIWRRHRNYMTQASSYFDLAGAAMVTAGCVVLDISVFFHMSSSCPASFVLTILGMAILLGVLSARAFTLTRLLHWAAARWKDLHGVDLMRTTTRATLTPNMHHDAQRLASLGTPTTSRRDQQRLTAQTSFRGSSPLQSPTPRRINVEEDGTQTPKSNVQNPVSPGVIDVSKMVLPTNAASMHHGATGSSRRNKPKYRLLRNIPVIDALSPYQVTLVTETFCLILLVFVSVLLAIWLRQTDPLKTVATRSSLLFNDLEDMYYDIETLRCTCSTMTEWLSAFLALNAVLLFGSCFSVYEVRKIPKAPNFAVDCLVVRLANLNAMTLFLGILLVMVVMPNNQQIVLSCGEIVYSLSTSAIFYHPVIARKL